VIVATYKPGDAITRVVNSLDAQTLPQDEFEVIFVDDGSPDDTWTRLRQIAATRLNVRIFRIKNSGWPSRPRNVGIEHASGEYLMFMDHDDSLFPDGLRRAYEYAKENDADLLSAKESKSDDSWWALSVLKGGNVPNALVDGGIEKILPMNPHKLYRRRVVLEHGIRFPERPRALWEDWYINIGVYRHSKVVSILADTPIYLWHVHQTNTSYTFSPGREDYWDRLDDVMKYIVATLDGPDYRSARTAALGHQIKVRVIDRMVGELGRARPTAQMAFSRARQMLGRYATDDVFAWLPKKHKAQAYLLRAGRPDLMMAFHATDLRQRWQTQIHEVAWRGAALVVDLDCRWEPKATDQPILRREGDRVVRVVGAELQRAIPPHLLDVTDDAGHLRLDLCVRGRGERVSWSVPVTLHDAGYQENEDGALCLVARGEATLDIRSAAAGRPLADDVWDFKARSTWRGMVRNGGPSYRGPARPLVDGERAAVAYSNMAETLSLDLAQRLRTLAMDAKPRSGPAGAIEAFSAPLDNIAVAAEGILDASMIVAIPAAEVPEDLPAEQAEELLETLAAKGALGARVVAGPDGARLEGSASLASGTYTIFARRGGKLSRTRHSLVVDQDGQVSFA
jgi:glycosyltransferase involved in cell wall biosynthesis